MASSHSEYWRKLSRMSDTMRVRLNLPPQALKCIRPENLKIAWFAENDHSRRLLASDLQRRFTNL